MEESKPKIYLDFQGGREHYYTLVGTPDALLAFASSVEREVHRLPLPMTEAKVLRLGDFHVDRADSSLLEGYLDVRAEPSDEWLGSHRRKVKAKEFGCIALGVGFSVLAGLGLLSVLGQLRELLRWAV